MRNLAKFFLTAALAGMMVVPAAAQSDDDAIVAVSLPDSQFRGFLLRTITGTDTFRRSFVALGAEQGCATFAPAFHFAFDRHAPKWRANLVQAWRDNVPADLLERAIAAGPGEAGRLVAPHGEAIGEDMEAASSPLLTEASAEVLASMAEAARSVDASEDDRAARIAELNALDTRNLCGVLGDVALPAPPRDIEAEDRPGPKQGR